MTSSVSTPAVACPCQNLPLFESSVPFGESQSQRSPAPSSSNQAPAALRSKVLCPACVNYRLEKVRQRRGRISQERDAEREACRKQIEQAPPQQILALQEQLQTTRAKANRLRQKCAQQAINVAQKTCRNDERRQQLEAVQKALVFRPYLARLQTSLLDGGSLDRALQQAQQQVRLLRFQWANRAFVMHRLDVKIPAESTGSNKHIRPKTAKGIGKIGGLPLPHAGAELYGVLPPQELESALRLVASVTTMVASCLGIVLPHPILLSSAANLPSHDVAQDTPLQPPLQPPHAPSSQAIATPSQSLAESTASLANLVGKTAKKVWGGAAAAAASFKNPLLLQDTVQNMVIPPSTDSNIVQERIRHASAVILAEDLSSNSSRYSLSALVTTQDQYATALQLLQNDVVILCIRAGVPVVKLWPAQAVLLNLQALSEFCKEQTLVG